jgi:starch synthase
LRFDEAEPLALLKAVDRALSLYSRPDVWRRMQHRGMGEDWSWARASAAYRSVYSQALAIAPRHH